MMDPNLMFFLAGIAGLGAIGIGLIAGYRKAGKNKTKKYLASLAAGSYMALWGGALGTIQSLLHQWRTGFVDAPIFSYLALLVVGVGFNIIWNVLKAHHAAIVELNVGRAGASHDPNSER